MTRNPNEEQYGADYFRVYQPDTEDHLKRIKMYRQECVRIHEYITAGNVLDVGCGVGDFLSEFDDRSWNKYGIDISPFALQAASEKHICTTLPDDCTSFFDLVVFRGTLQHLDEPFTMLKSCIKWLKPGGLIVFLATPNIGGICYRLFEELPMLDSSRNYMLVSDRILLHILNNMGLTVLKFHFPYLRTPYATPWRDCVRFALRCMGIRLPFAFWNNMMECYAVKPVFK